MRVSPRVAQSPDRLEQTISSFESTVVEPLRGNPDTPAPHWSLIRQKATEMIWTLETWPQLCP
jgi:hypothetical protein